MEPFLINVLGVPASKGSFRGMIAGGRAMVVPGGSSKNQAQQQSWDSAIRSAIDAEMRRRGDWKMTVDQPLRVTITFRMARPKGHYKSSGDLKASALSAKPTKKPDIEKLARCTLDPMTGTVFVDDSNVVELMSRKRYADDGEGEGATIRVEEIR